VNSLNYAIRLILLACFTVFTAADDDQTSDLQSASFDIIWETVNENHYDPTFGGVDWNAIYTRYEAQVADVKDDDEFIRLMNEMLQELGLSHYAVFRVKDMAATGSPLLSEGSLGLDIRLLGDRAVVSSVVPEFPAAVAGLRQGFMIESINDEPVSRIIEDARVNLPPHLNEQGELNKVADKIANRFFGDPGTSVKLSYRDGAELLHEVTLEMKARPGKTILSEDFPPLYVDFSSRRLPGDIGYVSFSAFLPPVDERFIAAMDSLPDLRGIIIDIRGNPGGMHEVGEAIASKLVSEETPFSIFRYRDSTVTVVVEPSPPIFDGPVVILIDAMNGSASERFSACMQSIGRAVIVGERSPGLVGPSDVKELPNGASFMYLIAQSLTPDGTVLEGHGVIPDIAIGLDPKALTAGLDTQLQRAIAYIQRVSE
jgi:C-terminal processing protease CtpA/Prc